MNRSKVLLIAYDGSICADEALDDLCRAGLPAEADALVVSVSEIWMLEQPEEEELHREKGEIVATTPWRVHARAGIEEARSRAATAAHRIGRRFPGWKVSTKVYANSPAWGVLTAAREIHPDLIVLGPHSHSLLGRLILGSVSRKVLAEARCSVRIGRHHPSVDGAPIRIIIGADGTPDSEAAVEEVARRTWPAGSAVRIIAVRPSPEILIPPFGPYVARPLFESIDHQRELLEAAAEAGAKLLRATGIPVTAEVIEGTPGMELLESAREWGADSIFVGARGHRPLERLLLGSVSAMVAARSECSVEVVRSPTW
jgi:nucleotide-binding universal stress UspA family protein